MKPWLWLPTQIAHEISPYALQVYGSFLRTWGDPTVPIWQPLEWHGLKFPNRLGIAGGVDKDAELIEDWWTLGCGFVEVGTVTPVAQAPNAGKIMGRDVANEALWNRMGFPGSGCARARENLLDAKKPWPTPLFANIGKNRTTSNQDAPQDYKICMQRLGDLVDGFVINISSPNTAGLRELLQPANLRNFLQGVLHARNECAIPHVPLLLKLSPDMTDQDLTSVTEIAMQMGLNGFVATNTTLARASDSPFPPEGGVSGRPLGERSKAVLKRLAPLLNDEHLLISVGGVMTEDDVFERLDLGADLVQVYTALIYEGPGFFRRVARLAGRQTHGSCPLL